MFTGHEPCLISSYLLEKIFGCSLDTWARSNYQNSLHLFSVKLSSQRSCFELQVQFCGPNGGNGSDSAPWRNCCDKGQTRGHREGGTHRPCSPMDSQGARERAWVPGRRDYTCRNKDNLEATFSLPLTLHFLRLYFCRLFFVYPVVEGEREWLAATSCSCLYSYLFTTSPWSKMVGSRSFIYIYIYFVCSLVHLIYILRYIDIWFCNILYL